MGRRRETLLNREVSQGGKPHARRKGERKKNPRQNAKRGGPKKTGTAKRRAPEQN